MYPTYKERQKRSIQHLKKDYEYYQKYTKEEIDFLFIEAETKLKRKKYTFPISYISLLSITFIVFYHLTRTFGRAIKNYGKATNYFESLMIEEWTPYFKHVYGMFFYYFINHLDLWFSFNQ